jgi:quercetin dioxygenase-like cupin family protein
MSTDSSKLKLEKFSFNKPTSQLKYGSDDSHVDVVNVGENSFARVSCPPGWRWSTHSKDVQGTKTCTRSHVAFVTKGHMIVERTDENGKLLGERFEYGPGDIMIAPPNHDAWVVGNEAFEGIDVGESFHRHNGHGRQVNPNRND